MILLPVVAREMSVLSRRRGTYFTRTATAGLAMFLMGWIFLVAMAGMSVAQMGQAIFIGLATLSFLYALFAGIHSTSDAISEEKREGTLGLLFLTGLRSYDITLGKLAATSFSAFYALLALIPTISLSILLGGVSLKNVGTVSVVLANTMFLSLGIGMLISAVSTNERRAIFSSCVVVLILTLGPFLTAFVISGFDNFYSFIVWPSPLYAFICVFEPGTNLPGFKTNLFYASLAFQHLLGWACLYAATLVLPGYVRGATVRWSDRLHARLDMYVYGPVAERKKHRRRLLDRNAFLWLAGRERVKPLWAWIVIAIFFILYFWVAWGFRGILFDLHTSMTLLFLVHLVIKVWLASEVCSRVIEDRRSGALELLLSSPLTVRQIAEGQHLALRRIFAGPLVVLTLSEICLMFLAIKFMNKPAPADRIFSYLAAISTLLLDLWALKWLGMWLSLFGKSIERVLVGNILRILLLPSILFLGWGAALAAAIVFYGRRPEYRELLFSWWIIGILFSLGYGLAARINFYRYCREAVADQHANPAALFNAVFQKKEVAREKNRLIPAFVQRHPTLAATCVVTLLLGGGIVARRLYWNTQFQEGLALVRSRNEPTKILEIARFYKPLAKQENAFALLTEAGGANRLQLFRNGTDLTKIAFNSSNFLHGLSITNRKNIAAFLAANQTQAAAFEKATSQKQAYIDPVSDWRYAGILDLIGYSDLAIADLLMKVENRDESGLKKSLEKAVSYGALLLHQPSYFAQTAAAFLLSRVAPALEVAFYHRLLSDETLSELKAHIQSMNTPDTLPDMLAIQRALVLDPPLESLARGRTPDALLAARRAFSELVGTRQQELTALLGFFEEARTNMIRSQYAQRFAWANALPVVDQASLGPHSTEEIEKSRVRALVLGDLRQAAEVRRLETAIAIEQFRRKNGSYPRRLESLVPEFLAAIPIDPFTGEPFKWKISSGEQMIWSIGPNGQDDGGIPFLYGNGDLTFRFFITDDAASPASRQALEK